jgi:hypothetical protein
MMTSVFTRVCLLIEKWSRVAADRLNRKVAGWGKQKTLGWLVVFCVVMGGWSVVIVWQSFHTRSRAVDVRAIKVPQHSILPSEDPPPSVGLTLRERSNIIRFQQWLDSLQGTSSGKLVYDSIVRTRPGLIDNLLQIQKHFSEQFKISEDGKKK